MWIPKTEQKQELRLKPWYEAWLAKRRTTDKRDIPQVKWNPKGVK